MEKEIKKIMAAILDIDENKITDETSIESLESWDSLNHINLVISFEEKFNTTITETELVEMTNFKKIKQVLISKTP